MWSFSPCPWPRHLLRFQLWNNPVSLLLVNSTLLYLSQIKEMETPVLSAASICNCKSATEIYIILPQDKSKFTCRIRISNSCISLDWSFKWLLADVRALKKKIHSVLWLLPLTDADAETCIVLYQEKRKAMMWMELTGLFDEKLRRWQDHGEAIDDDSPS